MALLEHGSVNPLHMYRYQAIGDDGLDRYGSGFGSVDVGVEPDGDSMTKFDGKVIGRVTMKFNGVVVAESIQTTAQVVEEQTDKLMIALELAVTKNA